jgi:hypothetical protein
MTFKKAILFKALFDDLVGATFGDDPVTSKEALVTFVGTYFEFGIVLDEWGMVIGIHQAASSKLICKGSVFS